MLNCYKKSKKEFKRYIKKNPNCVKEEWDNYAHKNNLFSSFTLECHANVKDFEELKRKIGFM